MSDKHAQRLNYLLTFDLPTGSGVLGGIPNHFHHSFQWPPLANITLVGELLEQIVVLISMCVKIRGLSTAAPSK